MAAIDQGHLEVVQYLVTQGADVDAKAEVCGCICQYSEIVLFLFHTVTKILVFYGYV